MRPLGVVTRIAAIIPAGVLAQTRQTLPAPIARTSFEGRTLDFAFPGMLVGTAEYDEGPTGVTVFYFPNRVKAVVDVRGGAPGTIYQRFTGTSERANHQSGKLACSCPSPGAR